MRIAANDRTSIYTYAQAAHPLPDGLDGERTWRTRVPHRAGRCPVKLGDIGTAGARNAAARCSVRGCPCQLDWNGRASSHCTAPRGSESGHRAGRQDRHARERRGVAVRRRAACDSGGAATIGRAGRCRRRSEGEHRNQDGPASRELTVINPGRGGAFTGAAK